MDQAHSGGKLGVSIYSLTILAEWTLHMLELNLLSLLDPLSLLSSGDFPVCLSACYQNFFSLQLHFFILVSCVCFPSHFRDVHGYNHGRTYTKEIVNPKILEVAMQSLRWPLFLLFSMLSLVGQKSF